MGADHRQVGPDPAKDDPSKNRCIAGEARCGTFRSHGSRSRRKSKARAMAASSGRKDCGRILVGAIAAMSHLSRETLFQARRGIMSERTRALFSYTISSIESARSRSAGAGGTEKG